MKHTRIQPQYCPAKCGYKIDTTTGAFGEYSPSKGDFLICMNCYAVLRFGSKSKLRLSSLEESEEFGLRQDLEKVIDVGKRLELKQHWDYMGKSQKYLRLKFSPVSCMP